MTLRPITATDPACFGVCCPQHGRCARYSAIDGLEGDSQPIATCEDGAGERPLFRAIGAAQADATVTACRPKQ